MDNYSIFIYSNLNQSSQKVETWTLFGIPMNNQIQTWYRESFKPKEKNQTWIYTCLPVAIKPKGRGRQTCWFNLLTSFSFSTFFFRYYLEPQHSSCSELGRRLMCLLVKNFGRFSLMKFFSSKICLVVNTSFKKFQHLLLYFK